MVNFWFSKSFFYVKNQPNLTPCSLFGTKLHNCDHARPKQVRRLTQAHTDTTVCFATGSFRGFSHCHYRSHTAGPQEPGGRNGGDRPSPYFGRSINRILTRGDRLCPPRYYSPPTGFFFRPAYGPALSQTDSIVLLFQLVSMKVTIKSSTNRPNFYAHLMLVHKINDHIFKTYS